MRRTPQLDHSHSSSRSPYSSDIPASASAGKEATSRTVSRLTRTIWPTSRTMYSGSSARLGSERMPLCSVTWYWSMSQPRAPRCWLGSLS